MPTSSPKLTLPASEQAGADTTFAVTGVSYSDGFAQANPGDLFLGITDSSGTLTALDASGHQIAGSGSGAIGLEIDYNDLTAALSSLAYAAAVSGSDDIHFDIWNQAGVETSGDVPVSITSSAGVGSAETWTGAVSTDWNTAGNWSGNAVPKSGDSVTIPGGTVNSPVLSNAVLTGETITLAQSGSADATATFNNVSINSLLQASGTARLNIGGTLTVGSQGTLTPESGATLLVNSGSAVPIINNGLIEAPSGYLTINNDGGGVRNNASILASGGSISFDFAPPPFGTAPPETLTNAGSIVISNHGGLTLNGTFTGNSIAFGGTGALGLQQANSFAGSTSVTGYAKGDQIDLYGTAKGGPISYANGILSAGTSAAIPLVGAYGLGNFESEFIGGNGNPEIIAYASDGGSTGGVAQPDITAPATATVAQGSTLLLGDVSIGGLGTTTDTLSISATSGTLYMSGANGNGTGQLTLGPTPASQIDADLATLQYVPAAGATGDTVSISVSPPAPVTAERAIPITTTSGSTGPVLSVPASETVSADAILGVGGSYSDSFAQHNPGMLFIGITDSTGTLSATDSSGHAVAGSGSNSIGLGADFADVNAMLSSLRYTAGGSAGSDAISFDIWNQGGLETRGSTAVTIGATATMASAVMPAMYTH